MDTARLSNLAPELIIRIFSILPNFGDVLNFATTSHYFHNIHESNIWAIYSAIAPRQISCYHDVHALIEAQDIKKEAEAREGSADQTDSTIFEDGNDLMKNYMKQVLVNARVVEQLCYNVQQQYMTDSLEVDDGLQVRPFSVMEYGRFQHVAYSLCTFVESPDADAVELLAAMNLRELILFQDVGRMIGNVILFPSLASGLDWNRWVRVFNIISQVVRGKLARLGLYELQLPFWSEETPGAGPLFDEWISRYMAEVPDFV